MLRILLAEDHDIVRQGLRALIEKHSHLEVVAEAGNGRVALELARQHEPDVVVMDIAMPELNGIDATRQLLAEMPKVKVIVLSVHSEKRYVSEMLTAGASAYLLKNSAFNELALAIEAVAADRTYLSPAIAGTVVEHYVRRTAPKPAVTSASLSPREREVLQLVAEGNSTKEIASALHLSTRTVDAHRQRIMEKLNLRSVAELTKYAVREGLTTL